MSISLVCIIGISTVFLGLVFLIFISYAMSYICQIFAKPEKAAPAISPAQMPRSKTTGVEMANKQQLVAGVCAVIAEELGTDVSNIRVKSFKKL